MSNAVKLAKAAADTAVITATATQTLSNKTIAGQLIVTSNTLVANLNSDMLDGKHVGTQGSAIPTLDGNNIWAGEQRFQSTATYLGDPTSNTYIEFSRATNYPFIDFHSNTGVDYSGRIGCSGATAGTGGGTLDYVAAVHNFASGDFIASWNYGTVNLGGSSRPQQINIGTGSTGSGNTKTIGFGTGGVAGSTTNINIGSWVQGALGKTIANQGMQLGSNGTPIYQTKLDFGSDVAGTWRKLFTVSLGTGLYQTAGYKIDIVDPNANHAVVGSINADRYTYYVACVRTEGTVQDTPDACYISGPASHIRAVKLSTGNYEIQVANEIQYQEYLISIQLYAENGGQNAATYFIGDTAGSAGIATYTAAVGTATDWFQQVRIASSGIGDALRITQTGGGNALLVEDSANPDADPFVIKGDGNVITGFTNQVAGAQYNPRLEIVGYDPSGSGIGQFHYSNDTLASRHQFNKTRATAPAGHVIVASNDELGTLTFAGSDGTGYICGAQISAYVDGTPGTNDMPGRIVFSTTADGASSPTARMLINSAGNVGIGTTTPSTKLHAIGSGTIGTFAGTGTTGIAIQANDASSSAYRLEFIDFRNENNIPVINNAVDLNTDGSSSWFVSTTPAGSRSADRRIERMRIDASGNVGIGTTTPSTKLHAIGSGTIGTFAGTGTTGIAIQANDASSSAYRLEFIDFRNENNIPVINNAVDLNTDGSSSWFVSTTPAGSRSADRRIERMRIDASGNVGIGTSTPTEKLTINGNISASGTITGSNLFGQSQTWTDVTSSRANNTTYTNTTGKPIMVIAHAVNSGTSPNYATIYPIVNGVSLPGQQSGYYGEGMYLSISFIVPNGATYSVVITGRFTTPVTWAELR